MRIFHDWEFLEDGKTIQPISVGLRAEDGHEYYAVFAGAPWWSIRQNYWLNKNVVPVLGIDGGPIDMEESYVKSATEIRLNVRNFILLGRDDDIQLWGAYCASDMVCLYQLYGRLIDLPPGIPMFTSDLQTEIARLHLSPGELPVRLPEHGPEHNALADARYEAYLSEFLREFEVLGAADKAQLITAGIEGRWRPDR